MSRPQSRGEMLRLASAATIGAGAGPSSALPAPAPAAPPPKRKTLVVPADGTCRGIPLVKGGGGKLARKLVEEIENPFIIIQDKSGIYKPQFHEFRPRNGLSTVPVFMMGHPDDVPGGRLFMSEASIYERKQKESMRLAEETERENQRREHEHRHGEHALRAMRHRAPSKERVTAKSRPTAPAVSKRAQAAPPPALVAEIQAACAKIAENTLRREREERLRKAHSAQRVSRREERKRQRRTVAEAAAFDSTPSEPPCQISIPQQLELPSAPALDAERMPQMQDAALMAGTGVELILLPADADCDKYAHESHADYGGDANCNQSVPICNNCRESTAAGPSDAKDMTTAHCCHAILGDTRKNAPTPIALGTPASGALAQMADFQATKFPSRQLLDEKSPAVSPEWPESPLTAMAGRILVAALNAAASASMTDEQDSPVAGTINIMSGEAVVESSQENVDATEGLSSATADPLGLNSSIALPQIARAIAHSSVGSDDTDPALPVVMSSISDMISLSNGRMEVASTDACTEGLATATLAQDKQEQEQPMCICAARQNCETAMDSTSEGVSADLAGTWVSQADGIHREQVGKAPSIIVPKSFSKQCGSLGCTREIWHVGPCFVEVAGRRRVRTPSRFAEFGSWVCGSHKTTRLSKEIEGCGAASEDAVLHASEDAVPHASSRPKNSADGQSPQDLLASEEDEARALSLSVLSAIDHSDDKATLPRESDIMDSLLGPDEPAADLCTAEDMWPCTNIAHRPAEYLTAAVDDVTRHRDDFGSCPIVADTSTPRDSDAVAMAGDVAFRQVRAHRKSGRTRKRTGCASSLDPCDRMQTWPRAPDDRREEAKGNAHGTEKGIGNLNLRATAKSLIANLGKPSTEKRGTTTIEVEADVQIESGTCTADLKSTAVADDPPKRVSPVGMEARAQAEAASAAQLQMGLAEAIATTAQTDNCPAAQCRSARVRRQPSRFADIYALRERTTPIDYASSTFIGSLRSPVQRLVCCTSPSKPLPTRTKAVEMSMSAAEASVGSKVLSPVPSATSAISPTTHEGYTGVRERETREPSRRSSERLARDAGIRTSENQAGSVRPSDTLSSTVSLRDSPTANDNKAGHLVERQQYDPSVRGEIRRVSICHRTRNRVGREGAQSMSPSICARRRQRSPQRIVPAIRLEADLLEQEVTIVTPRSPARTRSRSLAHEADDSQSGKSVASAALISGHMRSHKRRTESNSGSVCKQSPPSRRQTRSGAVSQPVSATSIRSVQTSADLMRPAAMATAETSAAAMMFSADPTSMTTTTDTLALVVEHAGPNKGMRKNDSNKMSRRSPTGVIQTRSRAVASPGSSIEILQSAETADAHNEVTVEAETAALNTEAGRAAINPLPRSSPRFARVDDTALPECQHDALKWSETLPVGKRQIKAARVDDDTRQRAAKRQKCAMQSAPCRQSARLATIDPASKPTEDVEFPDDPDGIRQSREPATKASLVSESDSPSACCTGAITRVSHAMSSNQLESSSASFNKSNRLRSSLAARKQQVDATPTSAVHAQSKSNAATISARDDEAEMQRGDRVSVESPLCSTTSTASVLSSRTSRSRKQPTYFVAGAALPPSLMRRLHHEHQQHHKGAAPALPPSELGLHETPV